MDPIEYTGSMYGEQLTAIEDTRGAKRQKALAEYAPCDLDVSDYNLQIYSVSTEEGNRAHDPLYTIVIKGRLTKAGRITREAARIAALPRCKCVGDVGHKNVWGTPFLMTNIYCNREEGHEGPHGADMKISITPAYTESGSAMQNITVLTPTVRVEWEDRIPS